ncbi:MAG: hypothetical protein OEO79_03685 [Gemmatimonadota bacterium]|nr:hypothetical protein [Gemmatimonadota bacterium]MDH3421903.1 hypothetical protein [Gemmatimonadota bacterium]
MEGEGRPAIRANDIESRTIQRRTFLGRFGLAAGLSGLLGYTLGCEPTDSCDSDVNDPITSDSDQSDSPVVDADFADGCDADGA